MFEVNPVINTIKEIRERTNMLRTYLDYDVKAEKLVEVSRELEAPEIWNDPDHAQALGKERSALEAVVKTIQELDEGCDDIEGLVELAIEEEDEDTFNDAEAELADLTAKLEKLEFRRMFSGEQDANNCYLDIQSGSGGTEAQDWAEMLMRMYLRWGEAHGFKTEAIEVTDGDVAGIKGCTIKYSGEYAFGWLRTETGVHRLVRKSPFDSSGRRHTSFASAFVYPAIDDNIEIDINPADLRVDTFRASGAGGQHVNKTDSAIRITHLPTGLVVECQDERSQHKNRAKAMSVLQARLNQIEEEKRAAEEASTRKSLVGSGDRSERIRTYNFPQGRVTDHRINLTIYRLDEVVEGDLKQLIDPILQEHQADLLASLSDE